jgi:hypothetical protein
MSAKAAEMAGHERQIATVDIQLPAWGCENSRRGCAGRSHAGDPQGADRAEAEAWSIRMEGYGGPAQPSPTIAQCLNGGYGWLQVQCRRCETEASIPLEHVRRPRDTPIWKLEAALKCRSCRTPRYAPPVHMIRLTEERQTAPYIWVHPDDNDR